MFDNEVRGFLVGHRGGEPHYAVKTHIRAAGDDGLADAVRAADPMVYQLRFVPACPRNRPASIFGRPGCIVVTNPPHDAPSCNWMQFVCSVASNCSMREP